MDGIATLIGKTYAWDENGVPITDAVGNPVAQEVPREIYVRVHSIGAREFAEGGQDGLKREYRFDTFYLDYEGENEIEYDGVRYSIYRDYLVPGTERVELYTNRKVGSTDG